MDFSLIAKNVTRTLADNSPVILTGMAVAGTVTTAVFASKAGAQATRVIEDLEQTVGEDLPVTEHAKAVWKLYIPSAAMGAATIACIISANSINTRRNAAIMSAYSLTDAAFKEYKEKVVEQIGEKKEQTVREEIGKARIENNPVSEREVVVLGKGDTLCYDGVTGRYFRSDMETIRKAVNDINQKCINEVYASQNDFYSEIGLNPTALGEELGWRSDHMLDISFGTHLADDGVPCLSLDYLLGPIRGYYREH